MQVPGAAGRLGRPQGCGSPRPWPDRAGRGPRSVKVSPRKSSSSRELEPAWGHRGAVSTGNPLSPASGNGSTLPRHLLQQRAHPCQKGGEGWRHWSRGESSPCCPSSPVSPRIYSLLLQAHTIAPTLATPPWWKAAFTPSHPATLTTRFRKLQACLFLPEPSTTTGVPAEAHAQTCTHTLALQIFPRGSLTGRGPQGHALTCPC